MSEFANTPEERELLASELALGLLDGEDLARARRLQLGDPDFAALVAKAQHEIAPLHEGFSEATVPETLKAKVNAAIDDQSSISGPSSLDPADYGGTGSWPILAIAASLVALALVGVLTFQALVQPAGDPPERVAGSGQASKAKQYVAQLATQEDGQFLVVRWEADRELIEVRGIGLADENLAPELWIIPADGTPRSFGTAQGDGRGELAVPAELAPFLIDGATLAVTMEDPAGSPHEAPTPPIIATGTLTEI
ncbi:MAG: anti-sigma factor [Pseudomonadota bacterium]